MQNNDTEQPRRRPWLERGVFLVVIAALGSWLAYDNLMGRPHSIVVDGKPVVTLESRGEAASVLAQVKDRHLDGKQVQSAAFAQRVTFRRAEGSAEIAARDDAVSVLDEMLTLKAQAYAIVVDEKVVTALPKEEDGYRALDLVKQKYAQRLKNVYAKPSFKENVSVDRRYLAVDTILPNAEKAAEYLMTVHEKPTYHTLKPGDRAVYITAEYGISLADLKKLNPGIDVNRLTEGDKLLVRRPKPPVTVVTKSLVTKITPIKAPAERGVPARTGKRQTWAVITYENGHEVSQDPIRVMTTWDKPTPKPARNTGKRSYQSNRR